LQEERRLPFRDEAVFRGLQTGLETPPSYALPPPASPILFQLGFCSGLSTLYISFAQDIHNERLLFRMAN